MRYYSLFFKRLPGVTALTLVLLASAPCLAKPLWKTSPDKGFIDDALAFSKDGSRLAYIHSDSATFMNIIVIDSASYTQLASLPIASVTRVPQHLVFAGNGLLLFISSDTTTGKVGVQLYDITNGKQLQKLDNHSKIKVISFGGKQLVAAVDEKTARDGSVRLSIALHDPRNRLRRIKAARIAVRSDNTLRKPPLRLMYWEPGNVQLVGMKKGKYDRKRDMRLPDVAVRYDVLRRKELWSKEPKDLVAWNEALGYRNTHPGQRRFMHVGNALKTLYLCQRDNTLVAIKLPIRWSLYEARSLKQRESWDGQTLHFSMTIDPVNPDAVARKKADKERMDLYRLDGDKPVALGQVLTGKRRFTWIVGRGKFAYLRKLKGFGRGGKTLELHASSSHR